jgi:hypothetical protein
MDKEVKQELERYEAHLEQYMAAWQIWRDVTGTSVASPTEEDLEKIIGAICFLDRCNIGLSIPTYKQQSGRKPKYRWEMTVERWTVPPSLAPESEHWEKHTFRGMSRKAVIKRIYGQLRQWLQAANIEPPDPDMYCVYIPSPYKSKGYIRHSIKPYLRDSE